MFEKITLRIFLICLAGCASLILSFVWTGGPSSEFYFKIAATFFILGLSTFLCWFVTVLYSLRRCFMVVSYDTRILLKQVQGSLIDL